MNIPKVWNAKLGAGSFFAVQNHICIGSVLFTKLANLKKFQLVTKYIFEQAFYRLILLIQKNEKINILSVPFINLNFPPSSGAKKGSDEWHFDHFTNIF